MPGVKLTSVSIKSSKMKRQKVTHPFSKSLLDFILQRNVFLHLGHVCWIIFFAHFLSQLVPLLMHRASPFSVYSSVMVLTSGTQVSKRLGASVRGAASNLTLMFDGKWMEAMAESSCSLSGNPHATRSLYLWTNVALLAVQSITHCRLKSSRFVFNSTDWVKNSI